MADEDGRVVVVKGCKQEPSSITLPDASEVDAETGQLVMVRTKLPESERESNVIEDIKQREGVRRPWRNNDI